MEGGVMAHQGHEQVGQPANKPANEFANEFANKFTNKFVNRRATFGQRRVKPRACVADGKPHIRTFLEEALDELGFITCECAQAVALGAVLEQQLPDLVVLGLSAGGIEAAAMVDVLATREFAGKVLLLGPGDAPMVAAVQELGWMRGLAMLPVLTTPFCSESLRASVATFLPIDAPPSPAVDATQALRAGWLELWYQPKIDTRTLALQGAEALIRIRHPTWGVVPPARIIADAGDPQLRALSQFVIGQAIDDWRTFVAQCGCVEIAIDLPIACLADAEAVRQLCRQMPDHPAFRGLIIELNATEVIRNLVLARDVARQVRFHNIAISIDDLGAEWPSLAGLRDFPFVELKVDRTFVAGCADNRLQATMGRHRVDLADAMGARTVAVGVETAADFLAVREIGFTLAQGPLFAKPTAARKFARSMMGRPLTMPR
jgi:EAL domain-containing protein (putative c-di-GMP-specific phosphodiesterase class I)